MAKIAIITDTHFGKRNDSKLFSDYFDRFYQEVFHPTIQKEKVDAVIHGGDVLDKRQNINFATANFFHQAFVKPIMDMDIPLHIIIGNHDTYYRDTNEINGVGEIFRHSAYSNLYLYENEPGEIEIDRLKMLLVPWICASNYEATFEAVKKSKARYLIGHLELAGFEMYKGMVSDEGLDRKLFSKFDRVLSGHFHQRSSVGNITYLGSPYEMTWSDHGCSRGFHILDTKTLDLVHYENPFKLFHKIYYDDRNMKVEELAELDFTNVKGAFLKIITQEKTNPQLFDMFVEKLTKAEAADVKIVEDALNLEWLEGEKLIDEAQDTGTILKTYIDDISTNVSKKKLKALVDSIYHEALNL